MMCILSTRTYASPNMYINFLPQTSEYLWFLMKLIEEGIIKQRNTWLIRSKTKALMQNR